MNYCIVENGMIANIIVCDSDAVAAEFGALPGYEGARIGDAYAPPPPPPTLEERVDGLETGKADKTEVDAITAAIWKGLSL